MRMSRLSVLLMAGLALGGCFQSSPPVAQDRHAPPQAASQGDAALAAAPLRPRGFFSSHLGGPYAPAPAASACGAQGCPGYSAVAAYGVGEAPYLLDAGDRLRITVFGQDGLTNSYAVDAAGNITMPLVGTVPARGLTTRQLSLALAERLKQGYIREPKVAIEVDIYRPFFIHGEVVTPGQYAYLPNMTVENAIAIAGGFAPRADKSKVTLSRTIGGQTSRVSVGLTHPLRPGGTLRIGERWF
jgi:polysaccharide export outer membrane protein